MSLPVKKIYIDTRFKNKSSNSNSDFKFQLSQTVQLPDNAICFVDDIIIPHSWYSIEDYNNKMYVRQLNLNGTVDDRILTIPTQNHTGQTLAAAIKSQLQSAFGSGMYNAVYNERKGTITITEATANVTFMIFTDDELEVMNDWQGVTYDKNNLKSMNDVLRNSGTSIDSSSFESGFIDLLNVHNLYMRSNLGGYSSIGPRGESNIIKKIPVTNNYGYAIYDSVVAAHDYIDVSKQLLSTLEFKLTDSRGNVVPLHGSNVSFSLIFSTMKEEGILF